MFNIDSAYILQLTSRKFRYIIALKVHRQDIYFKFPHGSNSKSISQIKVKVFIRPRRFLKYGGKNQHVISDKTRQINNPPDRSLKLTHSFLTSSICEESHNKLIS